MNTAVYTELKKLLQRRELYILLMFCVVLSGAAFLELIPSYAHQNDAIVPSTTNSFMLWMKSGIGQMFVICLIPFFATAAFGDSYYNEYVSGSILPSITRVGRSQYYIGKAIVVMVSSFFIIILVLCVNQLLCWIAFPNKAVQTIYSASVYDVNLGMDLESGVVFPKLYMNASLLSNFLQTLMAGLFGVAMGLLSYTISLFIRKNLVLVLGITTFINLVYTLAISTISLDLLIFVPSSYLFADPYIQRPVWIFMVLVSIIFGTDFTLLWIKIKKDRDILV